MKQTIEIEVPDGKLAVLKDNQVIFEDIGSQLPKTWEEFCEISSISEKECLISDYYGVSKVHHIRSYPVPRDPKRDGNILPSKKDAEQHLALMKLHQLRDYYRQGWIPDWKDDSYKYSIVYTISNKIGKYSIGWCCNTPYFLSFPTQKLAEEFLTNFRDLIEQAGDLI